MTSLIKIFSSAALASVIGASFAVPASAAAYDPASAYVEQFNGLGMHKDVMGATLGESDPASDYIESFGWTKMAAPHVNSSAAQDDRTAADIEGLR